MSEPKPHDRSSPPPKPDADFLRLADSNDGSTEQLDESPVADSSTSRPASNAAPDQGESGRSTSSGFDTILGKIVVERGLVSQEELDLCKSVLQDPGASSELRTLGDVLVQNEFVTRRQFSRLRTEFEADRSSQKIPGYRILSKLGSGAMATVFLAKQLSLDRMVAIKVLPKKFSANAKFIERFYKEGRAAAKLNDPNIVAAYDVGQAGDHHYFVMEYVDGETVYDRIVAKKRFSESSAVDVVRQVASALKHAHERGFIHRDIKPKNIMMSKAGTVKLADLGLARAVSDKEAAEAESGRAYGTPYYISPEQIRGQVNIGPAADIYGLGATFYHMLTGRVPFEGKNPSEVMHKHLKSELVPPDHINSKISASCAQVIEMMMAKDPKDRYQSADDLIQDLDLVRAGKPPHFARPKLDLDSMVTSLRTAPAIPVTAAAPAIRPAGGPSSGPLFMVLAVLLAASLIANAALLVAVLAR
ncbi:MAG: serine/threonine protein kinase [Phycisphaerales bacterium]|nr:serine/threonine protein kinase [Phycisphaerales bacterium]